MRVLIHKIQSYKLKRDSKTSGSPISPSIVIKIPVSKWRRAHSWGDFHMATSLKKQLERQGYHVLIQILTEWTNSVSDEYDVVIVFRGLSFYEVKPHQINIMWNISHPSAVTLEEYESYDHVLIASDYWAEKISHQVKTSVSSMLQCTDPSRFYEPTKKEKKKNQQQLLFVGNSRDINRKVLKDLLPTDYDLAVYGKNWTKLIPKKYIKGEYIPNHQLYKHYGSAEILLNDHWDDMREKGFVSNRIFDGLASGAFIITDRVCAMGELEEYVQIYDSKEELGAVIEYYLLRPEKRRAIASKGSVFVRKHHTFKRRCEFLSEVIRTLLN